MGGTPPRYPLLLLAPTQTLLGLGHDGERGGGGGGGLSVFMCIAPSPCWRMTRMTSTGQAARARRRVSTTSITSRVRGWASLGLRDGRGCPRSRNILLILYYAAPIARVRFRFPARQRVQLSIHLPPYYVAAGPPLRSSSPYETPPHFGSRGCTTKYSIAASLVRHLRAGTNRP